MNFITQFKKIFDKDMKLISEKKRIPTLGFDSIIKSPKMVYLITTKTGRFRLVFERQMNDSFELYDIENID